MEVSFRDARFPLQLFRGREYTLACNEMRIDNQSRRSTDYEHPHSDLADDLAVIRSLQDGCGEMFRCTLCEVLEACIHHSVEDIAGANRRRRDRSRSVLDALPS